MFQKNCPTDEVKWSGSSHLILFHRRTVFLELNALLHSQTCLSSKVHRLLSHLHRSSTVHAHSEMTTCLTFKGKSLSCSLMFPSLEIASWHHKPLLQNARKYAIPFQTKRRDGNSIHMQGPSRKLYCLEVGELED
jgi:hypothetical protein